jgi:hypothetical protein
MEMHEAVRRVTAAIARSDDVPDLSALEVLIDAEFSRSTLATNGYVADYKSLAAAMTQFFVQCRTGHRRSDCPVLSLSVDGTEIIVTPSEVLTDADGQIVIRSNRTGHKPGKDDEEIGLAAMVLAAQKILPGARVEEVYLADEHLVAVDISKRKLGTREGWLRDCLAGVRQGAYPTTNKVFQCPGCPHLFHCDAVPPGELTIPS